MRWVLIGASVTLLSPIGMAQRGVSQGKVQLDDIVRSMETAQATVRPQISYQVIREYRLFSAQDSKANSEVVAEVNFNPPASKDYRIQKASGSSRGQQLVRRVLDHEVEGGANKSSNAISRDNYSFDYLGEATLDGYACYVLQLKPKRMEKDLIAGEVWVDKSSFLIRQVEGEAEKTPSWWLKQVRVKLKFADMQGVWVQTSLEATADVRFVGTHTLTSHMLDCRRQDVVAVTPISGRSRVRKR